MKDAGAASLANLRPSFVDCNRRFLSSNHPHQIPLSLVRPSSPTELDGINPRIVFGLVLKIARAAGSRNSRVISIR